MVNFCAIVACGNKSGKENVSFFRIPAVRSRHKSEGRQGLMKRRRDAWIAAIRRTDLAMDKLSQYRICSKHFLSGEPSNPMDYDNPDWVPSLCLGYSRKGNVTTLDRYKRATLRKTKILAPVQETVAQEEFEQPMVEQSMEASPCGVASQTDLECISVETQTDLTSDMLKNIENDLLHQNAEKYSLKYKISSLDYCEENFRKDEVKLKFYTGLPNLAVFLLVLNEVSEFLSFTATSSLTKFQQLLLTLMKLRLNLKFIDLGYRFKVSNSTASRVFHRSLYILHQRLHHFIYWPEREQLRETMPLCFQTFGKSVAIIVDCFEIFTEKPSNLTAKCQTWSSYKHHQTVKYLIGICPQGVVSFISEGWGGRTSDKCITEECGILKKLLPGDVVLADRGFNIAETVNLHYATLNIPAFTKGKYQLDPKEVEDTRKIASVRIHVERVIGTVRQRYSILNGPLPIEMMAVSSEGTVIDQIVRVCCALNNMSKSVIPMSDELPINNATDSIPAV